MSVAYSIVMEGSPESPVVPSGDASRRTRRVLFWVLVAGIFTLVAVVDSSQLYVGRRFQERSLSWYRALFFTLPEWWLWALLTPLVFWLARRFPLQGKRAPLHVLGHVAASGVVAFGHMTTSLAISWFAQGGSPAFSSFGKFLLSVFLQWFHIEVLVYWTILGFAHAIAYYRQTRERDVRAAQLQTRLVQAQLQALKMQLHPHFLFNTLNAVSVLVRKGDNPAAIRMITGLSDLLRLALEKARAQEVTLKEEMEFVDRYLAIEKIRFRDRLKVAIEVAPDTLDAVVPNLILQPLVENAIRHGIAPKPDAGRVEVRAEARNGTLRLRVRDDGVGLHEDGPARPGGGVGLGTTRERLRQLYGERFRLDLRPLPGGGTEAVLDLPLRRDRSAREEVAHD